MRQAPKIVLTPEEKAKLDHILSNPKTPPKIVERAKIVILAALGHNNESIARHLAFSEARVGKWRARFAKSGLKGIRRDAPRSGRPPIIQSSLAQMVIEKTLGEKPPNNRPRWSSRLLGQLLGISHTSVHRIWRANNLVMAKRRTAKKDPNNPPKASGAALKKRRVRSFSQ
ncbi:MAG: helix-turn-helix domain-containing protein [Deltaproteobacteria bacterium]|jgi:transposase|nr:helix-turn-helix domain-containing protein [Deltaproteobacteria bacterium]